MPPTTPKLEVEEINPSTWHEDINIIELSGKTKLNENFKFDLVSEENGDEELCFQIRLVSKEGARELIFYLDGIKTPEKWMDEGIDFSDIEVNANLEFENTDRSRNVNQDTVDLNVQYTVFLTAQSVDKYNVFRLIFHKYLGRVKFVEYTKQTSSILPHISPSESTSVVTTALAEILRPVEMEVEAENQPVLTPTSYTSPTTTSRKRRSPRDYSPAEFQEKKTPRSVQPEQNEKGTKEQKDVKEERFTDVDKKYRMSTHLCCDEDHFYPLKPLECETMIDGLKRCTILENEEYYQSTDSENVEFFCAPCWRKVKDSQVGKWVKVVRNDREKELKMKCIKCHNWEHIICSGFNLKDGRHKFECTKCKPSATNLKASDVLKRTNLSKFMETYMKPTLNKLGCAHFSFIRLIASGKCKGDVVDEELKILFEKENVNLAHPYVYKHIGLFQRKINGVEELVFSVMVREYVEPGRKQGTTLLYYLDSTDGFKPFDHKGLVYKTFLGAYWSYAQHMGFWRSFVYASAPRRGGSYLFSEHPRNQKYLSDEQLYEWYCSAVKLAAERMPKIESPSKIKITNNATTGELMDELFFESSGWHHLMIRFTRTDGTDFQSYVEKESETRKKRLFFINFTPERPTEIRIADPDDLQHISFSADQNRWLQSQSNFKLRFDTLRRREYSTQIITQWIDEEIAKAGIDSNQPSTSGSTR